MFSTRFACIALALLVAACGGGDAQQPDPNVPQGPGSAPLAALETEPFMNEGWMTDDGQQVQILFYARENVRMSGSCRMPNGVIQCDAMQYLRHGTPIEMPHRTLDGRTSAGVKVCVRLNLPVVHLHNAMGSEDSACRFPDGSLVSTNALEHYGMRVTEP
ncbi:MAG TPA: hypothetical protein VIF62_09445 [Labilithrix sp.]|jgi:hypothetical protein